MKHQEGGSIWRSSLQCASAAACGEGSHPLPFRQAQIDAGFVVTAFASAGSRFKLLLFEQQADNRWELVAQVGWRGSNAGTGGAGQAQGWHAVAGLVSGGVALQAPDPVSAPLEHG